MKNLHNARLVIFDENGKALIDTIPEMCAITICDDRGDGMTCSNMVFGNDKLLQNPSNFLNYAETIIEGLHSTEGELFQRYGEAVAAIINNMNEGE